ncbi:MAG: hypothetical protein K0B14_08900 [Anaerolineaceae bacterium]|nr:hypothetical protein [Anaerolineaceae bacterium]
MGRVVAQPHLWLKPQADRFKPVQTGSPRNRIYPVWVCQTQVLTCDVIRGVLWGVLWGVLLHNLTYG